MAISFAEAAEMLKKLEPIVSVMKDKDFTDRTVEILCKTKPALIDKVNPDMVQAYILYLAHQLDTKTLQKIYLCNEKELDEALKMVKC